MSLREDVLDEAEIFDGEHLTEAAIILLGDGAGALVGPAGREHAERCGACCARVADAALASAEIHVAFAALREVAAAPVALHAQAGAVQAGAVAGAVQPGAVHPGAVHPGVVHPAVVQPGVVQPGVVHPGVVQPGVVQPGVPTPVRGPGWGGAWIGAGLVIAAVASAPALTGVASALARLREGLEVLLRVTLQVEQALRLASGRMETVRMGASWIAAVALVAVGLWIARRGPGVGKMQEEAR